MVVQEHEPLPEATVNGGAADEHGEVQAAAVQFPDDDRHLFTGADQQGRQADGVGTRLDGPVNDDRGRHLDTEIDDFITIVGDNGAHQIFADFMHIAVNRGQHHGALAYPLLFIQKLFQVRHGLFHHFGRLEHVGQDELALAEKIAHGLHGREQDMVQDPDGVVPGQAIVNQGRDAGLPPVDDLPGKLFFG